MNHQPIHRCALALALAAAFPVAVHAQAAPPAAAASQATSLEQVVVTATKRSQPAQQIGVAVSVLGGDELAARGVRKVNQLENEVPNLEVEPAFGGSQAQFRLRGVGFQDYASNNAGAVTVYVDEVALPLPVQTQGLLFDLDRVEVLRGPQGTLFGRNTTGGAVSFITRQPSKRFEAAATLGFASFGATEAEAYVSGPLSDALRGRLSLATQQGGAWQRNRATGEKLGDKDLFGLRGQLELDATRDLRVSLSVHAGRDRSEGQGLYAFVAQPAVAAPPYPVAKPALPADADHRNTGWGFAPAFLAQIGQPANAKPGRDNDSGGGRITVQWDLGQQRLTSITAVDRFHRRELADYDAQSLPLAETYFDSASRNASQELRLGNRVPNAQHNWLLGVYAAREKLDESYWSSFANSFGFPTVRTRYRQEVSTASLFGQADWRLASDLKLVTGLRQEREKRERRDFTTESIGPNIPFNGPTSGSFSNSGTSGKLALEWQASPRLLGYGSVSRGLKSGGFTAYNTFNDLALTPFKPEVLIAYEAGFKADPTPQLRVNAAVFHYDYRNQQILDAIKDPGTGATVGKIVNAPRSSIDGIEFELSWRPSAGLTLQQFVGYKDGKFKEYTALSPAADLAGQPLYFPRLNWGGSAAYKFGLGGMAVTAQMDASYRSRSRSFLNRINPSYDFAVPGYALANARLEVAPVDARWVATVYVRNLFDKQYDLTRNFFDLPLPVAAAGAPRTLGVQVRYEF
jgi:outer membrane receptor protein involved in Fe transport